MESSKLIATRPTSKHLVFDLVAEAGFNTTDWINSSSQRHAFKANPKYCYEWSFVEPSKVVVLNLWFANMRIEQGQIVQHNNFRADAEGNAGKPTWVRRATRLDEALQTALRHNLAVRVIVNDGDMRSKADPNSDPSRVTARELDPTPWTIVAYDWATGANTLARGVLERQFADQFDLDQADKLGAQRKEILASAFVRDPAVRQAALRRANGNCELCGQRGFEMHAGAVYLETHHIVPLSEGGVDALANVAAVCPNDHKKAHFALNRSEIRETLIRKIRAL